jgi:ABC-type glycerol-3-phosphate transport system substrate-binding protein
MQKEICLSQGPLQGVEALFSDSEVLSNYPTLPVLYSVMPTGQNSIVSVSYTAVSDVLQRDLEAALTGIMTPTAALNDAAARIDAINAQSPT